MKSNSHSPVTEMLSAKYKVWLTVGLAALFVSDLAACIFLWINGVPVTYWLFPFIFALVDGLYLLGVIFSNQRFKYARTSLIVYSLVTAAEIAIWAAMLVAGDDVVFEQWMAALWIAVHVLGLIAAIVTYVYASKRFKFPHAAQLSVAIVAAVISVLSTVVYVGNLSSNGYFGQGTERALIYAETEDGLGYVVTGVMDGKGDTVNVSGSFNNKPVVSVSYNVLTAKDVKRVNLYCGSSVKFTDFGATALPKDLKIYSDPYSLDVFRKMFYDEAATRAQNGTLNAEQSAALFDTGNRITPFSGGVETEVYVAFDYDLDSYEVANRTPIPTWFGKKGDEFSLDKLDKVEYVAHSDAASDADLEWNYENNKYIMNVLKIGDSALIGSKIASPANVKVSFDRIHKILPGATNDEMYDVSSSFPFTEVGSIKKDYKLTVASRADEILSSFDRNGFSVRWRYSTDELTDISFSSLAEVLSVAQDSQTVSVSPMWILDRPNVTISPEDDKTTVTYGDEYSLSGEATHPIAGVQYEYVWMKDDVKIGEGSFWDTSSMPIDGGGEYTLAVAVRAPSVTSLSSSAVAELTVNVARRQLSVEWTDPADGVDGHVTYDGDGKTITPALINTVDGDDVRVDTAQFTYDQAGAHTSEVSLTGADADCYYIKAGDEKHNFTIDPYEVDIQWQNAVPGKVEFTYNGKVQAPEAKAYGVKTSN